MTETGIPPSLLAAVCAEPDDDAPRLVAADYLEERDGPGDGERAEFIRLQVSLAPHGTGFVKDVTTQKHYEVGMHRDCTDGMYGGACCVCERCKGVLTLRRRERELLDARGYGWCDGLLGGGWPTCGLEKVDTAVRVTYGPSRGGTGVIGLTFRRGFVEQITLTAADWLAHADQIYWHPEQGRPFPGGAQPLRKVVLTTWPGRVGSTSGIPAFDFWVIPREWDADGLGIACTLAERPEQTLRFLSGRWPHLEFDLPQMPGVDAAGSLGAAMHALFQSHVSLPSSGGIDADLIG